MYRTICVGALLASSARAGTVIHVDDDTCPRTGDGTPGNPYCSIQTALDAAAAGDEIIVAAGTYLETIDFLGKAVMLHSAAGAAVTVIDAQGGGSVVTCNGGEGPDTVLEGFTITGGQSTFGGGMHNSGSSPTVIGCIFVSNIAFFFNGGLGGGMYNEDGDPVVIGCTFRWNDSGAGFAAAGGGMLNDNSNPLIVNCLFDANGGTGGGGMHNFFSNPTLVNCTFRGNLIGAIQNYKSDPVLTNCVLRGEGGQIFDSSSSSTVSYSNVEGGWFGAGSNNIDADPLFVVTSGCCGLHLDPGCEDPECEGAVCKVAPYCCDETWLFPICAALAGTLCDVCPGYLRLAPGSPCIDAGHNNAIADLADTDLAGDPRFADDPATEDAGCGHPVVVDQGAYEYQGDPARVVYGDLDGDGVVNVADLVVVIGCLGSAEPECCVADLDVDGDVDVRDWVLLGGELVAVSPAGPR